MLKFILWWWPYHVSEPPKNNNVVWDDPMIILVEFCFNQVSSFCEISFNHFPKWSHVKFLSFRLQYKQSSQTQTWVQCSLAGPLWHVVYVMIVITLPCDAYVMIVITLPYDAYVMIVITLPYDVSFAPMIYQKKIKMWRKVDEGAKWEQ